MKWIGKAAGGVIGALVLGPLGAALGLLLGHQFDEDSAPAPEPLSHEDLTALGERFFRATFRVMGYLAKADGRVSELEIAAARAVMSELRLNAAQTQEAIACFTAGKQPQFDCDGELEALQRACRGRTDLTRIFLEIQVRAALAGNNLEGRVRAMMQRVAQRLELSAFELAHIEAVLRIRSGAFRAQGTPGGAAPRGTRGSRPPIACWRPPRRRAMRTWPRRIAARSTATIPTSSKPTACRIRWSSTPSSARSRSSRRGS